MICKELYADNVDVSEWNLISKRRYVSFRQPYSPLSVQKRAVYNTTIKLSATNLKEIKNSYIIVSNTWHVALVLKNLAKKKTECIQLNVIFHTKTNFCFKQSFNKMLELFTFEEIPFKYSFENKSINLNLMEN